MRAVKVEMLVLNICVGESGDRLVRAEKVLQQFDRAVSCLLQGDEDDQIFRSEAKRKDCCTRDRAR